MKSFTNFYLIIFVLINYSFGGYSQIVELHEFGEPNVQWYIYSSGKAWEFEAKNSMNIETIEVKSVLASTRNTNVNIEIYIKDDLVAKWTQNLNNSQYEAYYNNADVRFQMQRGDKIVYKIYGGTSSTYYAGILGVNYLKLTGSAGDNYDLRFTSLSEMKTATFGSGYTFDGNNLYSICGGMGQEPWRSTSMERYNIVNDSWTEFVAGLIPRRYCSAEYIPSLNSIYVFNGDTYDNNTYTDTLEIVNIGTGVVSYLANNPYPVEYGGSAVWENKIYIFGGSNSSGFSNRLYEFDPHTITWTRLPDMHEGKQTSGEIVDGVLYLFGGYSGTVSSRIDCYYINTGSWSHLGEMPVGVSAHATTVHGKDIWIVGSYDDIRFLAVYDTEESKFTQMNSDMIGRRHAGAVAAGGNLFIFGGNQASTNESVLKSLEYANLAGVSGINSQPYFLEEGIAILNIYPNPFSVSAVIDYRIPRAGWYSLTVLNLLGEEVALLAEGYSAEGEYSIEFEPGTQSNGVLLCRIQFENEVKYQKLLFFK